MASVSSALTSSIAIRCTNETKSGICRPTGVWRLNWPAKRRSRVKACHRMRSASVGFRRNSRASPRTVPLVSDGELALPVLGEQRAQPRRLLAVEHAALGRALAPLRDRHHHAVQRVHVLLGRLHPGEDVAQVDQHGVALLGRAQEFDLVELAHQIVEEGLHLVLRGALGAFGHRERQRAFGRKLEPLIADQQHRLRQVERGKARIDRKGDDAVGAARPPRSAARSARGRTGCRPCRRRRYGPRSRARRRPAPPPAWPGRGRGRWSQTAASTVGDRLLDGRRTARRAPGYGRRRRPRAAR